MEPIIHANGLSYNPIDGSFIRNGKSAGHVNRSLGYRVISVGGKPTYAHRLAFEMMTGFPPVGQIDHINGNRADNSWANLRDVPQLWNLHNQTKARSDSTIGLRGVKRRRGRFMARIQSKGKAHFLGDFDTAQEAHAAYLAARPRFHAGVVA